METFVVELKHEKALQLLRDLEELDVIRIHQSMESVTSKLASKYRGALTREDGQDLSRHISQSRNEWKGI